MEKLKIVIVDDDKISREILVNHISKTEGVILVKAFADPIEAIQLLSSDNLSKEIDLAILDIEMPEITGLQLSKAIGNKIPIILSSAHSKYAVEGFDFNAIAYLVKPVSYEKFFTTISKASDIINKIQIEKNSNNLDKSLVVKKMDSLAYIRLNFDEIVFIEGKGNYTNMYTTIGEMVTTNTSLKDILISLPENQFYRIHKSHIVNFNYVRFIDGPIVTLTDNKTQLAIGETYRKDFKDAFKAFIL